MKDWMKIIRKLSTENRSLPGIALIVIAAIIMEVSVALQYQSAADGIRSEVQHRAETELQMKNLEIQNVLTAIEVAVANLEWDVEQRLSQPDSLYMVTRKTLLDNEIIMGSAVAFEPYYFKEKGRQFSPYTYRDGEKLESKQLGTDEYDYHSMEWYTAPMKAGHGWWSEPYFDEGGGEMLMSTYSVPIHDASGRSIGVYTADVSLDWISQVVNARNIYPSTINLMISRTVKIMANPNEDFVMNRTIIEAPLFAEDYTQELILKKMMAGQSGHETMYDSEGEKLYAFYAPVEGDTGWSMAVVCLDSEIYGDLRSLGKRLMLMVGLGLTLMGFILWRSIVNSRRLAATEKQNTSIESELHIASAIQMGLLPKVFPPFPDRTDVDIYASLVPAKEVGGDLYDFYIRDEKLFFCIGDVAGKGVPASLVMAVTRTLFRNISARETKPQRIIDAINGTATEENLNNLFATFFLGVLDLPTGRLRYCNAGHSAPVLISAGTDSEATVTELECESNLPLGIMKDWDFIVQETTLEAGTTIFLYTDGLTEAMKADGTLFGEKRMMRAIAPDTPKGIVEHMTKAVNTFVRGAEQSDDLTMLAILYNRKKLSALLQRSLTLPNDVNTVPQLAEFIDGVCEALHFDASQTMEMNLAVEEAVVNVMNYAYPSGTVGDVQIDAEANEERLKFTITDYGTPFDPTNFAQADTTLSAEDRPIGGLGIFMIRQYMDSINYERVKGQAGDTSAAKRGKNVLTLRKRLK